MHNRQSLEVWGDGSSVRDYFNVSDLVHLTKLAIFSNETGVYNAGSGVGVSVKQLLTTLEAVVNLPSEIIYREQRNIDVPAIVLDCKAAEKKFGWRASTSLQTGIEDYVKWYRRLFRLPLGLSKES
jgi:UDP-glucose 4-epimerase